MTLVRLIAATYWFVAMPLLLGMAWNKVKKISKPMLAATYMEGYLIWFAFFFVGVHVKQGPKAWMLFVALLSVACLVVLNKKLFSQLRELFMQLKSRWFVVAIVMTIISVLFVTPNLDDDVIEKGIDSFYVIPAAMTGLTMASLVHMAAAFGLLLFFFATYRTISQFLFDDTKKQNVFYLITIIFYAVMVIADTHLAVAVFQSIWNPTTLTISCLLPIALCQAIELGRLKKQGLLADKWKTVRVILMTGCTLLSAQMFLSFGAGYCGILLLLGLILV